jgi:hypothetical protein
MNALGSTATVVVVSVLAVLLIVLLLVAMGVFKLGHFTALFARNNSSAPKKPLTLWGLFLRCVVIFWAFNILCVAIVYGHYFLSRYPKDLKAENERKAKEVATGKQGSVYKTRWILKTGAKERYRDTTISLEQGTTFRFDTSGPRGDTSFLWDTTKATGIWWDEKISGNFTVSIDSNTPISNSPPKIVLALTLYQGKGKNGKDFATVILEKD